MSTTPIMLCVGGSRAETEWGLHDLSWKGFTATLSTRMERNCGAETHAEYMALPKAEQDKRKDVGGFVGGSLRDGLRRRGCCTGRSLITLDMDNCAPAARSSGWLPLRPWARQRSTPPGSMTRSTPGCGRSFLQIA